MPEIVEMRIWSKKVSILSSNFKKFGSYIGKIDGGGKAN